MTATILITGGAGFIGSHFADYALAQGHRVVVIDKLTYAGNPAHLAQAKKTGRLEFIKADIGDNQKILRALEKYNVEKIFHLAAESHVDNSIKNASPFAQTNIAGTLSMLTAARQYWEDNKKPGAFRFIHVSTDEVFGQLGEQGAAFDENSPYAPNSPYAASKAAADHLVRAWYETYSLPAIITHCSNNFGPRQHREKFIPTVIAAAIGHKPIPVYGDGRNIRDWLYVGDFCAGLYQAGKNGAPGEHYCFGGDNQKRNIDLAQEICGILDAKKPRNDAKTYAEQITFVTDRKGHDWRYALNSAKAKTAFGWAPAADFRAALETTIDDYLSTA